MMPAEITIVGPTHTEDLQFAFPMAGGMMQVRIGWEGSGDRVLICDFYGPEGLGVPATTYGYLNFNGDPEITDAWPMDDQRFAVLLTNKEYDDYGSSYNSTNSPQPGTRQVSAYYCYDQLVIGQMIGDTISTLASESYDYGGRERVQKFRRENGYYFNDERLTYAAPKNAAGLERPIGMLPREDGSVNYLGADGRVWTTTIVGSTVARGALLKPARNSKNLNYDLDFLNPGPDIPLPEVAPWLPPGYYVDGALGLDIETNLGHESPGDTPLGRGLSASLVPAFDADGIALAVWSEGNPEPTTLVLDDAPGTAGVDVRPTLHVEGDMIVTVASQNYPTTTVFAAVYQFTGGAITQRAPWVQISEYSVPQAT